jgi:hypothetical protein
MQEAKDAFKSKATSPKHAGTEVATQELELTDSELSAISACMRIPGGKGLINF